MNRKYGWKPDIPDLRDHLYAVPHQVAIALPPSIDLRATCPPVLDQGQLGSCTSNAIANAHYFDQMKQGLALPFAPARLFIYYNERAMEGTIGQDAGAMIRDGIKSISKQGVCAESLWPYNVAKFAKKPTVKCFTAALKNIATSYQRVAQTLDDTRGCLAAGYPFVFGFTVYSSFESQAVANTGIVPMPTHEKALGGHAVLCCGYNDVTQRFLVMNSWGTGWGMQGYFTIPYAYLTNARLASDFWTVRVVK